MKRNSPEITTHALPEEPTGFDYDAQPDGTGERYRQRGARIMELRRTTVLAVGEIDRILLEAERELARGTYLPWLKETGLSQSRAYRYRAVHEAFGDSLPTVGTLPVALVLRLAERSMANVRASVLARAERGEVLDAAVIRLEVSEASTDRRQRSTAERDAKRRAGADPNCNPQAANARDYPYNRWV